MSCLQIEWSQQLQSFLKIDFVFPFNFFCCCVIVHLCVMFCTLLLSFLFFGTRTYGIYSSLGYINFSWSNHLSPVKSTKQQGKPSIQPTSQSSMSPLSFSSLHTQWHIRWMSRFCSIRFGAVMFCNVVNVIEIHRAKKSKFSSQLYWKWMKFCWCHCKKHMGLYINVTLPSF